MKKILNRIFLALIPCFFIIALARSGYDTIVFISGVVLLVIGIISMVLKDDKQK